MDKPDTPKADKRVFMDGETGVGMQLKLWVQDPEVLAELRQRDGAERDQYALTALRVGVIALRQAGGLVDAEKLKQEGGLILKELEKKLQKHTSDLESELNAELEKYFDPTSGHFNERVGRLVNEDGELATLLKSHLVGDNSLLARELAAAVGTNSPLMRHLDPANKEGLIETLTRIAQERLEEQSSKVLGEFDLNNEEGALKRLIAQIETNFNPDNPKTALGVLTQALQATQDQIRKDLTLDVADDGSKSPLSKMQDSLLEKIAEIALQQVEFQKAVSQQLGIKQVQARTTEGGFTFEHAVGHELKKRVLALGDLFESTGELRGDLNRLTGDHVQTLGDESAHPGGKIVYECKRDQKYRLSKAREELDEARRNRGASVGVFVMSAQTLREQESLRAEYPSALARYGSDIVVVWDAEDRASDVNLDAAVSLARALIVRGARESDEELATDIEEMAKAVLDLDKQVERFEKMSKSCDSIVKGAEGIKEELNKIAKRISIGCRRLTENIESLRE